MYKVRVQNLLQKAAGRKVQNLYNTSEHNRRESSTKIAWWKIFWRCRTFLLLFKNREIADQNKQLAFFNSQTLVFLSSK